ncbi:FkbM family methyltransferase [Roseicyclus persicicus]|uniref:FkbM family methyltransferase n=1 Tax=Roseicyclus persicicus TaxID=2650661 RepID=A0A7X6GZI2_9RHOB|nr:FkbM family methyltransferase [Roseibacterium persicicum]NKX45276.1 FkbM family methyltransferase [Roseibacterium persicicum]
MGVGFDAERARFLYRLLAPARLTRVVDVGANPLSAPPYAALLKAGLCEVWGFEPHPEAYAKLSASAGPHEHYLPVAVGSGAEVEFRICASSGMSSSLEPNRATFDALGRFHDIAEVVGRTTMATCRLDDLAELPDFELLKIDIQGGETAVFEGAQRRLTRALAVITEAAAIPIYVDQPLIDAQILALRPMGFFLHKFKSINSFSLRGPMAERMHRRKFRSQMVDGDVVFLRGLLELGKLSTEELKHMALLADAVFDSQDVTVACLAQLVERSGLPREGVDAYLDRLPHVTEAAGTEGAA